MDLYRPEVVTFQYIIGRLQSSGFDLPALPLGHYLVYREWFEARHTLPRLSPLNSNFGGLPQPMTDLVLVRAPKILGVFSECGK